MLAFGELLGGRWPVFPALGFAALALGGCWPAPSALSPGLTGSIGLPHLGTLEDGVALSRRGPGFVRLRGDDGNYGSPRLVATIRKAAAAVKAARAGAPLVIGDLSSRLGGRRPGHRSHRTGRDVDLLFYVLKPDGRSVQNPEFVRFRRDGLAMPDPKKAGALRFDTERNWLLVKALVEDPDAQVQWLFVARWLEALMVEHALARGETDELLWRAANLMHQPGDSFPHDDHFHVRLACRGDEPVHGCAGGGYQWPWLEPRDKPVELDDAHVLAALLDRSDAP